MRLGTDYSLNLTPESQMVSPWHGVAALPSRLLFSGCPTIHPHCARKRLMLHIAFPDHETERRDEHNNVIKTYGRFRVDDKPSIEFLANFLTKIVVCLFIRFH